MERTFPRILRRVWRLTDPRTRTSRHNDALGEPTPQQRFSTLRGDYWVCARTGHLTREEVPPRPEDLIPLYDGWWSDLVAKGPPPLRDADARKRFLARFAPYRKTGRLFEVGSGLGEMLKIAREVGWEAEGNELSGVAARFAAEFSGSRVHAGPIESVTLEDGVFDVIVLKNVFEHFESPARVLAKLARALRPGGALFLQTLNAQSLSLYVNPRGWTHFIEGHLHVPTLMSLSHYFRRAGLRVVRIETHGFTTKSKPKREENEKWRRFIDRWVANVASRFRLGHRVIVYLERA